MWRRVLLARRNLLSMWEEPAFEWEFVSARLLLRRIFLCNSPESVQFAFSTHNSSFERKSPEMRNVLMPLIGDGLFVSDGDVWRRRRRIVAPIVHVSRLSKFAPIMVETAVELRNRFMQLGEPATIDALHEMAQLTAEIICRTLFGRELGRNYSREVVAGFSEYQRAVSTVDFLALLGLTGGLPPRFRPAIGRSVRRITSVLDRILLDHRANCQSDGVSVIGQLFDARDEDTGRPLDWEAVRNEATVLFMAGHETTANSLAWTWYLLSQAPEVEARMHAEIDQVLNGRLPTLEDVPKLTYTRAVFEEALRLYPPVPLLTREAVRTETFKDTIIPKGSMIMVVPWLLNRHKKLWERPDEFLPERFLPGYHKPATKFSYVPFSIGPRVCPGMGFGLTEAILCIATLAQAFQFRLSAEHSVHPVCRITLRPGDTLPMRLQPRPVRASGYRDLAKRNAPSGCPVHNVQTSR
jgi:cytochrome P450